MRKQYFYLTYKFLGIFGRKRFQQHFWIMIWIYYHLLNQIILDLDLVNSYCIQKIPNFATNNIWFFTDHIIWSKEIELTKLDCITNCLKGRIYCESFLSNYFVKYYINVNVTVYLNIKFQLNCFFKLSWNISMKKVLAFQKQKISSSEIVFQKRLPHAPLILLF